MCHITRHLLLLCTLAYGTCALSQDMSADNPTERIKPIRALLTPLVESTLSSQIAGRIEKITVRNGERFNQGDHLIEFDCTIQKAQLQKARSELLAISKRHEANLKLLEYKSIGDLEVAISAAEVDKARAEYALVKAQVNMCIIEAPFNGRVIKRIAEPYESVNQGEALIEILDDSELKVELYVPSRWLSWLKQDTQFTVHIDETGKTYPARMTALGARVDAVSQSIEITAVISGTHPELLSGMSGEARFEIPGQP
ncbi:MAG: efflux RND transporter periplasmic adaptor subunit [Gammaproteobacteria bacterium]